jgi:hypothetical protein
MINQQVALLSQLLLYLHSAFLLQRHQHQLHLTLHRVHLAAIHSAAATHLAQIPSHLCLLKSLEQLLLLGPLTHSPQAIHSLALQASQLNLSQYLRILPSNHPPEAVVANQLICLIFKHATPALFLISRCAGYTSSHYYQTFHHRKLLVDYCTNAIMRVCGT